MKTIMCFLLLIFPLFAFSSELIEVKVVGFAPVGYETGLILEDVEGEHWQGEKVFKRAEKDLLPRQLINFGIFSLSTGENIFIRLGNEPDTIIEFQAAEK